MSLFIFNTMLIVINDFIKNITLLILSDKVIPTEGFLINNA